MSIVKAARAHYYARSLWRRKTNRNRLLAHSRLLRRRPNLNATMSTRTWARTRNVTAVHLTAADKKWNFRNEECRIFTRAIKRVERTAPIRGQQTPKRTIKTRETTFNFRSGRLVPSRKTISCCHRRGQPIKRSLNGSDGFTTLRECPASLRPASAVRIPRVPRGLNVTSVSKSVSIRVDVLYNASKRSSTRSSLPSDWPFGADVRITRSWFCWTLKSEWLRKFLRAKFYVEWILHPKSINLLVMKARSIDYRPIQCYTYSQAAVLSLVIWPNFRLSVRLRLSHSDFNFELTKAHYEWIMWDYEVFRISRSSTGLESGKHSYHVCAKKIIIKLSSATVFPHRSSIRVGLPVRTITLTHVVRTHYNFYTLFSVHITTSPL